MGALFGKTKKPISRITDQDKAVLQLKQQRDKVKQYQNRLEKDVAKNHLLAKKFVTEGKRDRAKLILKKKRYQEQLLSNADAQLENLERLTNDIEFAQIEIQVLDGLKSGNQALSKIHEMLSLDDIEQILDETKEGISKQKEIDDFISGELNQEDEDAVEAELEAILDVKDALPEVPDDQLPAVTTPAKKEKHAEKKRELLPAD